MRLIIAFIECMALPQFSVRYKAGIYSVFFFSFSFHFQVVQEYERSVIFRLGRLRKGGAKGPGIFFIIPCIDTYRKVDLRTVSFDVPPQEVRERKLS